MKRLLLPLIAALAIPTAVSAETYWLVLREQGNGRFARAAFEKIEMKSMAECHEVGEKLFERWWPTGDKFHLNSTYACVVGK